MKSHSSTQVKSWLQRILKHEGGFTKSRSDPGNWTEGVVGEGELRGTRWGISAAAYPYLNIERLSLDDAVALYQRDYVRPLKLGRYRDGVAYQLLDFGVNAGPARAIKRLQKGVGVTPDGVVGPITLAALARRSESDVVTLLLAQRIDFLTQLRNWPTAGRGWMRRIADNLRFGAADS